MSIYLDNNYIIYIYIYIIYILCANYSDPSKYDAEKSLYIFSKIKTKANEKWIRSTMASEIKSIKQKHKWKHKIWGNGKLKRIYE